MRAVEWEFLVGELWRGNHVVGDLVDFPEYQRRSEAIEALKEEIRDDGGSKLGRSLAWLNSHARTMRMPETPIILQCLDVLRILNL